MRSGARVDGMVNIDELLINVVNGNKPKVLTSPKRQVARCKRFEFSHRR